MDEAWSQKLEKMSDFDREQWCEFDKWRGKRNRVRQSAPVRCLANVIDKGKGAVREVPGVDAVTKIVHKSLQPLLNSVSQVGGQTVRRGGCNRSVPEVRTRCLSDRRRACTGP